VIYGRTAVLKKPDWEITATTIYCEAVDDEVTLIINADGTSRCTGRDKYLKPDKETARAMRKKSRRQPKAMACRDNECTIVKDYRDNILGQ
jgi:hypothetical protein